MNWYKPSLAPESDLSPQHGRDSLDAWIGTRSAARRRSGRSSLLLSYWGSWYGRSYPGELPLPAAVRQMTGWGPVILLAACLLLTGWLHLKAARLSQSASPTPSRSKEQVEPEGQARTDTSSVPAWALAEKPSGHAVVQPAPGEERIFVNKNAVELVAPFSSGLTAYKAQKLVADYLTKWAHWIVPVTDVAQYGDIPHVSAYIPDEPRLKVYVNMFFRPSELAKVLNLEKREMVEVEGRIIEISDRAVRLEDCRLLGTTPPA